MTQFFEQGENLIFDLIVTDQFDNAITDYTISNDISATFIYGNEQIALLHTKMASEVHFYSPTSFNPVFKDLPPRKDYYKISVTSSDPLL